MDNNIANRLMLSTLQTPFIYYTNVDDLNAQAAGALQAANGYFEEGNSEKTVEYYRKALQAQSNSSHLMANLGAMLCSTGNMQEGVALLKKASEATEPASGALYNLGTLLISHGLYQDAANLLERVASKEKDAIAVLNNLAVAQFNLHKYPEALETLEKIIAIDPSFDYSYANKGLIEYAKSNFEDAKALFESAVDRNEKNFMALNNLACALYASNKNTATHSFQLLKKAIELQHNFQMAYYNIGLIAVQENMI